MQACCLLFFGPPGFFIQELGVGCLEIKSSVAGVWRNSRLIERFFSIHLQLNSNKMSIKKEWVSPELIVLTRNNSEEAVLTACKGDDSSGTSSANLDCIGDPGVCAACDVSAGS